MSRMIFRFDETSVDLSNRETLRESTESSVNGGPGMIPLEAVLEKFSLFLKGCGYDLDSIQVNNKRLIE